MILPQQTDFLLPDSLESDLIKAFPLTPEDFEILYKVASDKLIWEQHPNPERYKREVFQVFFKGAIESGSAYLVFDSKTNEAIGSSRFYDYNKIENSVAIGYTFLSRDHWGTVYNQSLKSLMLAHAFNYVTKVKFHIGANNIRSQKAIEKLGAVKVDEVEMAYYGEAKKLNFIYQISKTHL